MKKFYTLLVSLFAFTTALAQCNYQLILQDNFGQGWASTPGAGVSVTINGGTPTFYTITTGGTTPNIRTFSIPVANGDAVLFDYTPPSFSGDGQWSLLDSEGISVFNSGFNPGAAADFSGTASCPRCPAVTALTAGSITANTAEIGWTNGGAEVEWEIEYGVSPYTVGSGGLTVPATTNPFTIMGLSSVTTYDVYVRAKCGTDLSSSRGPITFTTTESCPAPSSIGPITNTSSSISFVWNANGNPALTTEIRYGVTPFTLTSPNPQNTVQQTAPFANVTGLMSDTEYSFFVRIDCGNGDFSTWAGPYTARTLISCAAVSALSVDFAGVDTANLTWNAGQAGSTFEINYAITGVITQPFTNQGITSTTTTPSAPLAGLVPNTTYDFYVRAICDPSLPDVSAPRNISFTTQCTAIAATTSTPYVENFETFTPTVDFVRQNCWSASFVSTNTFSQYSWDVTGTGTTPSAGTGPNAANSGTRYMFTETLGNNGDTATLFSPVINVDGLTNPSVQFFYHLFGVNMGNLSVDVFDGTTWQTGLFTSTGQIQTSGADPFEQAIINLAGYTGDIQVRFVSTRVGFTTGDMAIDDFSVQEAPACAPVGIISMGALSPTTAEVSWQQQGSETSWIVEYGPAGFVPGTSATDPAVFEVPAGTNPFTITGLLPFTNYEVYVRANCGAGSVSAQKGPRAFRTDCAAFVAPYFTNFENFTPTLLFVEENCWTANADATYDWNVDNAGSTPSAGTGPLNAFSGTTYFYIETNGGVNGDQARLISPLVDITPLTTPAVQFKYHMFGPQTGSLIVDINDGTGWINDVFTLTGQQQTTQAEDWRDAIVDLSAVTLASNTIQVRLRSIKAGLTTGDISIDDFRVDEIPTCPTPSALTIDQASITQSGAIADWTENGTATLYDVEWGPAGYTQGAPPAAPSGGIAVDVPKPYTFTNLPSSTVYDYYVRAKCGPGDESFWAGPFSFQTLCGPVTAPYFMDFEGFTATTNLIEQVCWVASPTTGFTWDVSGTGTTPSAGTGPLTANSGTKFIFTEASTGAVGAVAEIVSPDIDLTPLSVPSLQFYYHMFGNQIGTLDIQIDDNQGGGFVTLQTIGPGAQQPTQGTEFYLQVINLSAYIGQTVQIKFRVTSGGTFEGDIAIDDFRVDELPTCPDPNLLTASNFTDTSASLSWSENGSATVWEVEVQPVGVARGTMPAAFTTATATNPQTVTGLLPDTSYDYYVRSVCSPTDQSRWVGPFTFKTECAPIAAPTTENFETFTASLLFTEQNCWKANTNSTSFNLWDWNLDNAGGTPTANTGPDAAFNGTNYFYIEGNGGVAGNEANLLSPLVNVSSLTSPALLFNYHMFGAATGILHVDINDGTGFVNDVLVISGQQQTSGSAPWELAVIDLSSYASGTIQARFRAERTETAFTGTSDIAIDNVVFGEAPACAQPSVLSESNVTSTGATLSWNENGSATSWIVEYGPCGFTPGTMATGAVVVNATTNTGFPITGLTSATCYDFYVTSDCGSGTLSSTTGPRSFTTALSGPVGVTCTTGNPFFVWTEGFNTIATNWTGDVGTGTTNGDWNFGRATAPTSTGTGPNAPFEGSGFVFFETSGTNVGPARIVSPPIDLTGSVNDELELSFYYHAFGGDRTIVQVEYGTSPTGPWTSVFSYTGQVQTSATQPFQQVGAMLPSSLIGQIIHIRISGTEAPGGETGFVGDVAIDLMRIQTCGTFCAPPTAVTVSPVTDTTASMNWSSSANATVWEYVNQLAGTGLPTAAGTPVNATTVALTGLSPATAYEFYVRSDCGMGVFSTWAGPFNYETACAALNAPYTTGFENFALTTTFVEQLCWTTPQVGAVYSWDVGTGGTSSTLTGPLGAATGSNYFFTEASTGAAGAVAELVSPLVNLAGFTNPTLTFNYHMWGADITGLNVDVNDGTAWTNNVFVLTGQQQAAQADPWRNAVVPLTAFTGNTVQVRFRVIRGASFDGDVAIDDIVIDGTAGVDSPETLGFSYYPNPTTGVVNFNGIEPIETITVRNMLGQLIETNKVNALNGQLNLANYAIGMYLVEVATAGKSSVVRVIKE